MKCVNPPSRFKFKAIFCLNFFLVKKRVMDFHFRDQTESANFIIQLQRIVVFNKTKEIQITDIRTV